MKTFTIATTVTPTLALITWMLLPQTAHCFYNSSTGRWLSRDPIGERGGVNLYQFVRNSTVDRTDRLGLDINVITGPVHCDLCGGKVYNSQKACCRQGKIISRTETEEVMLTFRKANLPGGGFAYTVGGKSHCSVTTSEGETGQGKMGAGVPGQGAEGCACTLFTEMVDHTGQSKESGVINVKVKVNKCCFLSRLEVSISLFEQPLRRKAHSMRHERKLLCHVGSSPRQFRSVSEGGCRLAKTLSGRPEPEY